MLQFGQTNLQGQYDAIGIEDIRRQIAMGLLAILAFTAILINIIAVATVGAENTNFVPVGASILSILAFVMLRQNFLPTIAKHIPIIMYILVILFVIDTESQFQIIVEILLLVSAAIITRLPTVVASCVFVAVWNIFLYHSTGDITFPLTTILEISLAILVFYVVSRFENVTITARRTNSLLQASSNIGQSINADLDLQQLLDNTINTVRQEFNFYHAQVFLIDDRYEYANLVASTGEAGKQLLARNHRLPVGSKSVIGRVSQVGEPVVSQNTDSDTVHALNELLPDTRAELALPLIDAGNIIGALDVQSVNPDAFQPIDIQALQIIANQLAVAIRNARLFEEAQRNIQENKRILFDYETNLREVDRLNRTLTQQSWDRYLGQTYIDGVTLTQNNFAPNAEWTDIMTEATMSQQPQTQDSDDDKQIAIPILLRGQVLGAIEVTVDSNSSEKDTIEMIQAIGQRLAISLESARLFEEAQEASVQEQQINEIVSSYETAVTIDELLHITLEKLQQSLGAEKGSIRLGITAPNGSSTHHHNGNGGTPS